MVDRVSVAYEASAEFEFAVLEDDLRSAGVRLERPVGGQVWILDGGGEHVPVHRRRFEEQLAGARELNFQWWIEENSDVYCRIVKERGRQMIELGMEGLDPSQRSRIGAAWLRRFARVSTGSVLWIFDPEGVAQGYPWGEPPRERVAFEETIEICPQMIGVRTEIVERLSSFKNVRRQVWGDVCVLTSAEP